jgi:hypothetical protein
MDKQPVNNEDIFNECLEAVLRGESPEDCLSRYPQQADEIRPLLQMAMAARCASHIEPRQEFRARARYEYRSAVAEACEKSTRRGFRWSWRWSTAVPVAVAVMMMSGGGVMAASTNSLPGQPLYSVKLAMEQMQLNMTPAGEAQTKVYAAKAERREDEMVALAGSDNQALVGEASLRLESTLSNVTSYMAISDDTRQIVGAATAPVPESSTSEVFTTSIWEDGKNFTGIVPPQAALPSNYTSIDPELLSLLKEYAARDQVKLQQALDSLPESTRLVLQHVLESYGAILSAEPTPVN